MDILLSFGSIILGLILLTFGGNALIDGAIGLSRRYGISEAIIGLTIVAIGTSMPEMIVSVLAAYQGNTEIAIGNVLGSNIANVFLILGMTVFIRAIHISRTNMRFDIPVAILTCIILGLLVSDKFLDEGPGDRVGRIDGFILLIFALIYIIYSLYHNNISPDNDEINEKNMPLWKSLLYVLGGVGVLFIGGKTLVDGAVEFAEMIGVSEAVIGLTIVAIGTSMPELVTSIVAAKKGSADLALGNIVGSNIMNILIILGVTAVITPVTFAVTSYLDLALATLAPIALLIFASIWTRGTVGKKEGTIMVTLYVAYVSYLLMR